jgi:hypothetical protein
MVDIDGVISLFAADGPSSAETVGRPGGLHAIDGTLHFLSATAAAHLLELGELYELVWASGWEERADEHLPRLLGLPAGLPFLSFPPSAERSGTHWKLEAIDRFGEDRALAWIDDGHNEACHAWAAQRAAPTLLVATEPQLGLTEPEARLLQTWALGLRTGSARAEPGAHAGSATQAEGAPQAAGAARAAEPAQAAGVDGVNGARMPSETAAP